MFVNFSRGIWQNYIIFKKLMQKSTEFRYVLRKNFIQMMTEIDYRHQKLPLIAQCNKFFQFLWIYTFKASLFTAPFNSNIHGFIRCSNQYIQSIATSLTRDPLLALFNLSVITPFVLYILTTVLEFKHGKPHNERKSCITVSKLLNAVIGCFLIASFTAIPTLAVGIRWIYTSFTDPSATINIGLLCFTVIAFLYSFITILLDSNSFLLGPTTIAVIFCCFGMEWNVLAVQITGLLLMLSSVSEENLSKRSVNPFVLSMKLILLFIFFEDAIMPSISVAFMILFTILIGLVPFGCLQADKVSDKIEMNQFFLEALQQLKQHKLKQSDQFKVLKSIYYYQEEQKGFKQYQNKMRYKVSTPLTYGNLCDFLEAKIAGDMSIHKNQDIYHIHRFFFQIRHRNITLQLLEEIAQFTHRIEEDFNFSIRSRLLQLRHELDKKLHKISDEEFNLAQIIGVCTSVQDANTYMSANLQYIDEMWSLLEKKELHQGYLTQLMNAVEDKEDKIKDIIQYLQHYPNTKIQIKLYNYALKLCDFNYQSEITAKAQMENCHFTSTYFVILTQNKITNISSQMLLEIHRKKADIIGESLEYLIPKEIVDYINKKFSEAFMQKQFEKIVLPFVIPNDKSMVLFNVQLQVMFTFEHGIQKAIHFFNSNDLKGVPMFLYCASTDKIINSSVKFNSFMKRQQRKITNDTMAFEIFGVELRSLITDSLYQKQNIQCTLLKQKQSQMTIPISLKVRQIFTTKSSTFVLFSLEDKQIMSQVSIQSSNSLSAFKQKKINLSICTTTTIPEIKKTQYQQNDTFCPIPNPYETYIDEKMTKIKLYCRCSYLWVIAAVMAFLFLSLIGVPIYTIAQTNSMGEEMITQIESSSLRTKQLQYIYYSFYQYYQYDQIKNYPHQLTKIQSYDIPSLVAQYQAKVSKNIKGIINVKSNIRDIIATDIQYTMEYENFNLTKNTSDTSIIDFLSDMKQALYSDNALFTIQNEHNVDLIASSYKSFTTTKLENNISTIISITFFIPFLGIFLALAFKCLVFKLTSMYRDILLLYEQIPDDLIKKRREIIKELRELTQSTDEQFLSNFDDKKQLSARPFIEQNEINPKDSSRIKNRSFVDFLFRNNLVFLISLVPFVYFFWTSILLTEYQNNVMLVNKKSSNLQNVIISILVPAQKFFQAAQEEKLPPSRRRFQQNISFASAKSGDTFLSLPSFFDDYLQVQTNHLHSDVCKYAYLNNGSLYNGIDCYQILDGIMKKTYSQIFHVYEALVRNYTGIGISKLGEVYRLSAKYPVYLEICYVRRTLNNLFQQLQSNFTNISYQFIQWESNKIVNIQIIAITIYSLIFVVICMEFKNLWSETRGIIKAFKMLPKDYLVKMKTTKLLKNHEILNKLQVISL